MLSRERLSAAQAKKSPRMRTGKNLLASVLPVFFGMGRETTCVPLPLLRPWPLRTCGRGDSW